MNNLPLQPLVWFERKDSNMYGNIKHCAQGAGIFYTIMPTSKDVEVYWADSIDGSSGHRTLKDVADAKEWVKTDHYPSKMQPYVKQDSITDIRNWFKKAKPEPTHDDVIAQMACHFEEVDEMIDSTNIHPFTNHLYEVRRNCKQIRDNNLSSDCISKGDNLELLDSLCDQIVTATGVAYMMGFDIEGALKEVIRSNNSKMVDGKFEFDDNGKIAKPDSYIEPDLTPFISTVQNNKGE